MDTVTRPCQVFAAGKCSFRIILTQGLNRQIRRMCEYLGFGVTGLKRLRVMNVHLGGMRPGQWRLLSDSELSALKKALDQNNGKQA